jgi:hypothetical protein
MTTLPSQSSRNCTFLFSREKKGETLDLICGEDEKIATDLDPLLPLYLLA